MNDPFGQSEFFQMLDANEQAHVRRAYAKLYGDPEILKTMASLGPEPPGVRKATVDMLSKGYIYRWQQHLPKKHKMPPPGGRP